MKQDQGLNIDGEEFDEVDEYLDEQYEDSTEIAAEFVDEHILPLLDEFDYNNPDPDYVPGCATFGVFARVVNLLLEQGFTVDELKTVVDDFASDITSGEVLH